MPEQNYHAPINTVVNMDVSGDFAGLLSTGLKLTPRAWLAPTLVNREPQVEAIVRRIDAIKKKNGCGKLLIVVPGTRPDLHQGLVLRCGLAHFVEYYDQSGWDYLGRVPWPRKARAVLPILKKIGEALSFPKDARDQPTIEDKFTRLPKSVCFSHYLDAAWWNEHEQGLVLDWVDYLCNAWPVPALGRFVVAFLCLDSGASDQEPFKDLITELNKRNQGGETGSILITERLDLVCSADVDDWVSEVGRYLKLPAVEAMLLNIADELFSVPGQLLHFEVVYKGLCAKLAAILPPGPIYTKGDQ